MKKEKSLEERFMDKFSFKNLHLVDNITIAAEQLGVRDDKILDFIKQQLSEQIERIEEKVKDTEWDSPGDKNLFLDILQGEKEKYEHT